MFHHFFFFNVALQQLGPIDQNYVLFVGSFNFWISIPWDFFDLSCSFVNLYYRIHCFFNFEFCDVFIKQPFLFKAFLNWHFKILFLGEKGWFLQNFKFLKWRVRISKMKISKSVSFYSMFCSLDRDVWIIKGYQFQNVNGTRIWGTLWNCIESSEVELLILARFLRHSWRACLSGRRPHKMGRQLSGGPVGGEVGWVNLPRRSCTKRYRSHITGPERYRMWIVNPSGARRPILGPWTSGLHLRTWGHGTSSNYLVSLFIWNIVGV